MIIITNIIQRYELLLLSFCVCVCVWKNCSRSGRWRSWTFQARLAGLPLLHCAVRCVPVLFSTPAWWGGAWGANASHRAEEEDEEVVEEEEANEAEQTAPVRETHAAPSVKERKKEKKNPHRRKHEEQPGTEGYIFICRGLSEAAGWRGGGGDLWPPRILFWRILSDGRTVRMMITMTVD